MFISNQRPPPTHFIIARQICGTKLATFSQTALLTYSYFETCKLAYPKKRIKKGGGIEKL